jgi:hypothetical protein
MSLSPTESFLYLEGRDPDVPEDVERDQWGRPLILQPDGSKIAYTRVSTAANMLEHQGGLEKWRQQIIVKGMAARPDILAACAALPSKTGNRKKDELTSTSWREYLDAAFEAGLGHEKANWGSATHGFTEPGMRGNPLVPAAIQGDVDSYWGKVDEYRVRLVGAELFVVNDELRFAGRFDDLYWIDGFGACLGDKKTGKAKVKQVTVQKSIYANSKAYDPRTGERREIVDAIDWERAGVPRPDDINRKWAFFVHIPLGEGFTTFFKSDIEKGYAAAKVAAMIRDFRSDNKDWVFDAHEEIVLGQRQREAIDAINIASDMDQLRAVAHHFHDVWTDWLTTLGHERAARWAG